MHVPSLIIIGIVLISVEFPVTYTVGIDHNASNKIINATSVVGTTQIGADFVCYREENYTELVKTTIKQPVRVRSHNWCLEFPPRCSSYKTEIREVIKLQNVTKLRVVEHCCNGYAEVTLKNETVCKPVCHGGCGRGFCDKPNECKCNVGYVGRHCTQRCRFGRWGEGCQKVCKCRNGAPCDYQSGACECTEGWIGDLCEVRCPQGYYGLKCAQQCECSSFKCDPKTGECIADDDSRLLPQRTVSNVSRSVHSEKQILPIKLVANGSLKNKTLFHDSAVKSLNISATLPIVHANLSTIKRKVPENSFKAFNLSDQFKEKKLEPMAVLVQKKAVPLTTPVSIEQMYILKSDKSDHAVILHHDALDTVIEPQPPILQTPKLIHVISKWPQKADNREVHAKKQPEKEENVSLFHDLAIILAATSIFLLFTVIGVIVFIALYRKHIQESVERRKSSQSEREYQPSQRCSSPKILEKPLPDLPAFTQNLVIKEEYYDRPSNNSAIQDETFRCSYRTSCSYSPTFFSRLKPEALDPIYDEVNNPRSETPKI